MKGIRQLPGGVIEEGLLQRTWRFHPVSGNLELALSEAAEFAPSMPKAVTQALLLALDQLGSKAATEESIAELCVADRQFLMRELDCHLGFSQGWLNADCLDCGSRFDFYMDYEALPIREAGPGYPLAIVEQDCRFLRFRLPTGRDQELLASIPAANARAWLLNQLALEPDQLGIPSDALLAKVDAALEAMSPAVVLNAVAQCPECGTENNVDLDPYGALSRQSEELLQQVHRMATHYHWSEREILSMPKTRRECYLEMIDRSRGMA